MSSARYLVLFLLLSSIRPEDVSLADESASTIAITSTYSSGPGSIREAIERANRSTGVKRIISKLPPRSVVYVFHQLPALKAPGVDFDAGGLTLSGHTCLRPQARVGCDGIVVTGPKSVVRNLHVNQFTFDGIAVRGPDAKRVRIEHCRATGNEDDGVGISAGATDVVVKGCTLQQNGYRTKGKGVLVFDYASATLIDNVVRYNRDGVTVSRRAHANLVRNAIIDNYDKGLGVAGASASGRDNLIARNGAAVGEENHGPNADGLRVSLDSDVTLEDTRILDNGDVGMVALGTSRVRLEGGRIAGNAGFGTHVRDQAVAALIGVALGHNGRGDVQVENEAKLTRSGGR